MQALAIALAQINITVGAISENADKIVAFAERAAGQGAYLIVFPELALSGYPPEDLLLKRHCPVEAKKHAIDGQGRPYAVQDLARDRLERLFADAPTRHGLAVGGEYELDALPLSLRQDAAVDIAGVLEGKDFVTAIDMAGALLEVGQ